MSLLLLFRVEDEQAGTARRAAPIGRQHRRLIVEGRTRAVVTGHVDVTVGTVVPVEDDWILLLD